MRRWWTWRRRRPEPPPAVAGRIPDGDVVVGPDDVRWATLVTRELPTVPLTPPMYPRDEKR